MTEISGLADAEPTAGAALPAVVLDSPAAVLLVDLGQGEVVYANHLAQQLAPGVGLPAAIGDWSRAAGLHDASGQEMEESSAPLQRVAAGEPVAGEAVTAARGSDATEARESLWVVGVPLTDAPPPLGMRALVVMLPMRDHAAVEGLRASSDLRHRAVLASDLSFSISDPHREDNPLVWVNPAFERTTGYTSEQVVGKNCRFLQGPGTDRAAVARIARALRDDEPITEVLLNHRADGTAFWNEVVISPVFDADGRLTHHVGVQSDVTLRVEGAAERDRALEAARRANARLEALSRVSEALASRFDSHEALASLPGLVVPSLAAWAFVVEADAQGRAVGMHVAHGDPAHARDAAAMEGVDLSVLQRTPELVDVLSGSVTSPVVIDLSTADGLEGLEGLEPEAARALEAVRLGRVVLVPLRARGRTTAVLGLVVGERRPNQADLTTMADVGLRAGLAVDNARLYEREHAAALTLQRSLLPELPSLDGFDVAATYLPASVGAEVGGDWYDVLDLPDGGVGVAIGDVMGHDLQAAAAMGQLRSVLRSYAWSGDEPGAVVRQLDLLVRGLGMAGLATCVYARIQADDEGGCVVTYAKAGHPPPLMLVPGEGVLRLDQALSTPIGVAAAAPGAEQAALELRPGASLVLYTDGLLERRDRPLREGIEQLEAVLRAAPPDADAETLRDLVVEGLVDDVAALDDDTCVLIVRHR